MGSMSRKAIDELGPACNASKLDSGERKCVERIAPQLRIATTVAKERVQATRNLLIEQLISKLPHGAEHPVFYTHYSILLHLAASAEEIEKLGEVETNLKNCADIRRWLDATSCFSNSCLRSFAAIDMIGHLFRVKNTGKWGTDLWDVKDSSNFGSYKDIPSEFKQINIAEETKMLDSVVMSFRNKQVHRLFNYVVPCAEDGQIDYCVLDPQINVLELTQIRRAVSRTFDWSPVPSDRFFPSSQKQRVKAVRVLTDFLRYAWVLYTKELTRYLADIKI